MPDYNINLTSNPKTPLTNSQATGLCKAGYDYFVTYKIINSAYTSSTSFGYPESLHCGYIKKIKGQNDINNNPQYLKIDFQANSFPYMRSTSGLSAGTGWNANSIQILVNEQPSEYNYDIASVPATGWTRVSSLISGGNGVYRASDAGDNTIDPDKLNIHEFVMSRQDYNSGSTYVLYSGCTMNQNILNFGDESFFFGNIKVQTIKTKYYEDCICTRE